MAYEKRKSNGEDVPVAKKVKTEQNGLHFQRAQHFQKGGPQNASKPQNGKEGFLDGTSSKETHQKQKQLKRERLAAKPNADSIARSKKIWERLRIKSAVPPEERKQLVDELFSIITGRVKEFVFKHDLVRVIQCALKYAAPAQKQEIAVELKGSYRELAESKYAKFLIAKLLVLDTKVRDLVVPEFYGHVKRLIRHPEASWIMDDIYRSMASPDQKVRLLREWYGAEYVVFGLQDKDEKVSADLSEILKQNPGKRGPIMQHLKEMTNQLVQKKTTGFTMLHDALLQYFINCTPGSSEHNEFLEMLKDDEEGDLFKNLAFTKSGSRVVCLALAHGSSKDRRNILKHFKTHIKLLACDPFGHLVLLAAYEVIDDTVMTGKAIFPELTCKDLDEEAKTQEMLGLISNINGRIPLLYLMAAEPPKWLLDTSDHEMIKEVRAIRETTSKKDPSIRRLELVKVLSRPLIDFIAARGAELMQSSYGCQFMGEVLIGGIGDKDAAFQTILTVVGDDSRTETATPHAGRLLKSLVQGGRFDTSTKTIVKPESRLDFSNKLYGILNQVDAVLKWATSDNSWTIVAMLESCDFDYEAELKEYLKKHVGELQEENKSKAASTGQKAILEKLLPQTNDNEGGGVRLDKHAKKGKVKNESA